MTLRSVSSMIADAAVENYTKNKIIGDCSFIPLKLTNFAHILQFFDVNKDLDERNYKDSIIA